MKATSSQDDPLNAILPRIKFSCKNKSEAYYSDLDFCDIFHYCKVSVPLCVYAADYVTNVYFLTAQLYAVQWLSIHISVSKRFILQQSANGLRTECYSSEILQGESLQIGRDSAGWSHKFNQPTISYYLSIEQHGEIDFE